MARVVRIDLLTAHLPFRFSFGHALAERRSSTNVYVRLTLDDGSVGYGEGVPREYVTGETVESALAAIANHYAPALLGQELRDPDDVPAALDGVAETGFQPAAFCALELALLDASGRHFGRSAADWLGRDRAHVVQYDAVIPFTSPRKLGTLALLIRALGIRQVKIKVGDDLERDLAALRLLRRVLGRRIDLRVDANCAWTADEALRTIEQMRRYDISAVEQPVPGDDLDGLRRVTAGTKEAIIVDESLRTVEEASVLAETRACDVFNIRISKCGGLLRSKRIADIAAEAGLGCVVGAQVGESGILSSAGRHLAAIIGPRYLEGSGGSLLLKEDLTEENVLPGWRGRARPYAGPGLGVRVRDEVLRKYGQTVRTFEAAAAEAA